MSEPEHNVSHAGPDGCLYGYFDGRWEFWSGAANLLGEYDTWAEALVDFPELKSRGVRMAEFPSSDPT